MVVMGLAFPFLLLARKLWATRTVQFLLILAAAVWMFTLVETARQRFATGESWIRMAIILGVVALLNVASVIAVGVGCKQVQQQDKTRS